MIMYSFIFIHNTLFKIPKHSVFEHEYYSILTNTINAWNVFTCVFQYLQKNVMRSSLIN